MKELRECSILIVDDNKINVDVLVNALGSAYDVSVALDGRSALASVRDYETDLILLDIMMPGMDGYEVIRHLKEDPATASIPVIFLSAFSEIKNKSKGFQLGAVDYIIKPFEIEEVKMRVKTHLTLSLLKQELEERNQQLEEQVRHRTRELILTQQATIFGMGAIAEYRDPETGAHINRVKGYVTLLALHLASHQRFARQLNPEFIELFTLSAPMHDIGKVGIPDHILLKPGPLTEDEYETMKLHTLYGRDAVLAAERNTGALPFLSIAKDLTYTHHERWDGTGYPQGLRGEQIPLCGRIMAVADVYDALISKRVYKDAVPHAEAVEAVMEGRGTHFDPDIADAFAAVHAQLWEVAQRFGDGPLHPSSR